MTDTSIQPAAHRDNMLGICHALGEDLGVNPLWLRLALGALLLVNLELPFIVYGVLGLIVLATRLLVRGRKRGGEVLVLPARREPAANDQYAEAA